MFEHKVKTKEKNPRNTLFGILLAYRGVMLVLALILIFNGSFPGVKFYFVFAAWVIAVGYTFCIYFFQDKIINLLEKYPNLALADAVICAVLLLAGGGWQNVFYAYVWAPIFISVVYSGLYTGLLSAFLNNIGLYGSMFFVGDTLANATNRIYFNSFFVTVTSFYLIAFFCYMVARLIAEAVGGRQNNSFLDSLPTRQRAIASYVPKGYADKEIARALLISEPTVKKQLREIYTKHELKNRAHLAAIISNPEQFQTKVSKDTLINSLSAEKL